MESDKERALSEREHLETARAFSEAGSRVTELRTKLKSAINKSRYIVQFPLCDFLGFVHSVHLLGS